MPVRKSINQGMTAECRKAMYVFQFLYDSIVWTGDRPLGRNGCTIGACYDDEVEFANGFAQLSPALSGGIPAVLARLRKFMKQLVNDGWIYKTRIYNDQHYVGEMRSGYYPFYQIYDWMARDIHSGRETAESFARQYTGCKR